MKVQPKTGHSDESEGETYGPVQSLEEHVDDDWWSTLFGPTYLLTDSDVLTDALTREEVDRVLSMLRLSETADILDLCCGQGRHTLELARRGYRNVRGLDRSEFLINKARAEASLQTIRSPSFQVGDCRDLPFPTKGFDAVLLLGNSFGYFSQPEEDRRVLAEVRRVLRPGGQILLDLASGRYLREHFEARSWEWVDEQHLVCREREMGEGGRRLISREVLIHVKKGVLEDQFYAERIYDRGEITNALYNEGYIDVKFGKSQDTNSERGQDLGMMARRFWVTARPANGATVNGQPKPSRRVAVILGDPTLPDETKLGGCFDEDDFEVTEKLKSALATLDGYTFEYFDDHARLRDALEVSGNSFDLALNFCDEGLQNRPEWELHVPVLLEMLGIPYSGAGPHALAHCYDKSLVRGVAREIGVPVAQGFVLPAGDPHPSCLPIDFPVLVKPNKGDNSAGIMQQSLASTQDELVDAVDQVRAKVGTDRALLIETFLPGKDLTFGLIGNPGSFVRMPITEDDYSDLPADLPRLCGYEAKWIPESPYWTDLHTVPADLSPVVQSTIERESEQMFERLGCRDYARFDWRLDSEGRPRLLEVNPNPGWCWDGHLNKGAAMAGYTYADMLRLIMEAALRRYRVDRG